jgi:hypothetical protein
MQRNWNEHQQPPFVLLSGALQQQLSSPAIARGRL